MTKEHAPHGASHGPDEDLEDERDHPFFAGPAEVTAETYPSLRNISVGFIVNQVARAPNGRYRAAFAPPGGRRRSPDVTASIAGLCAALRRDSRRPTVFVVGTAHRTDRPG